MIEQSITFLIKQNKTFHSPNRPDETTTIQYTTSEVRDFTIPEISKSKIRKSRSHILIIGRVQTKTYSTFSLYNLNLFTKAVPGWSKSTSYPSDRTYSENPPSSRDTGHVGEHDPTSRKDMSYGKDWNSSAEKVTRRSTRHTAAVRGRGCLSDPDRDEEWDKYDTEDVDEDKENDNEEECLCNRNNLVDDKTTHPRQSRRTKGLDPIRQNNILLLERYRTHHRSPTSYTKRSWDRRLAKMTGSRRFPPMTRTKSVHRLCQEWSRWHCKQCLFWRNYEIQKFQRFGQ